jgi:putative sterol carrier protein
MNKGVEMLMKLGRLATKIGPGRAGEERARVEMRGLSGVLNLEFTGPEGGGWHVAFSDGKVAMAPGLVENARATLKLTPEDYLALLAGDLSYSVARMTGKVRVSGDGHFGIIFGAFVENLRAAQRLKGVRGLIARGVINRALKKGNYIRREA